MSSMSGAACTIVPVTCDTSTCEATSVFAGVGPVPRGLVTGAELQQWRVITVLRSSSPSHRVPRWRLGHQLSISAAEELLRVRPELRRDLTKQVVREPWTPAQARTARPAAHSKLLESKVQDSAQPGGRGCLSPWNSTACTAARGSGAAERRLSQSRSGCPRRKPLSRSAPGCTRAVPRNRHRPART
jgi:hypothetical protein